MASFDSFPIIKTDRLRIRLLEPHEAGLMLQFRIENRRHLEPWEPLRSPDFFTEPYWHMHLRMNLKQFRQGVSVCLSILDPAESQILGVCNYTNIIRGTLQACHLGYALGEKHQGQGLMFEALEASNRYMFDDIGLHRIMANYLPHNHRSAELLEKLGFRIEGRAEKLLKINGRWEDHILTSLINPRGCE